MDGFRFWRTGFWKDHLRGKPYHISALYVIDLARFRCASAAAEADGVAGHMTQETYIYYYCYLYGYILLLEFSYICENSGGMDMRAAERTL